MPPPELERLKERYKDLAVKHDYIIPSDAFQIIKEAYEVGVEAGRRSLREDAIEEVKYLLTAFIPKRRRSKEEQWHKDGWQDACDEMLAFLKGERVDAGEIPTEIDHVEDEKKPSLLTEPEI